MIRLDIVWYSLPTYDTVPAPEMSVLGLAKLEFVVLFVQVLRVE